MSHYVIHAGSTVRPKFPPRLAVWLPFLFGNFPFIPEILKKNYFLYVIKKFLSLNKVKIIIPNISYGFRVYE